MNDYTFENEAYKNTYRHTAAHILAQAVKRLFPETKLAIGPAIADGFYYDFDTPVPFTPEVLEQIEAEMRKIIKEKLPLEQFNLPREEALALMADEPYKLELIHDLPEGEAISFYKQGEFTDLCAGSQVDSTGRIKANAMKLTSATGA
ncbi:MAG: threonine--tRNA ligase, partial [Oscillospiraceae bacterium]|nr:threonine--tRNA ligase [Oscillospiraceae bacterium]